MVASEIVKFVISIIKFVILSIIRFYVELIKACFNQFDTIVECSLIDDGHCSVTEQIVRTREARARSDKSKQKYFFLGFFVFAFNAADTVNHLYRNGLVYDNENSPIFEIFSHQMYPRQFWYHGDMIILAITCFHPILFLNLWLTSWIDSKYYMFAIGEENDESVQLFVNGKEWDRENAKVICDYRRKSKRNMKIGMIATFAFLQGYFSWFFEYKGTLDVAMMQNGWKNVLQYWFFLPPFLWYCQVGSILTFYHFFIASRYVMIKQKYMLKRMDKLIGQIVKAKNDSMIESCYREFVQINHLLAYQLSEIRGYNRFWSMQLSCHFGADIVQFCYMLYSALFIETTLEESIYFYWFMAQLCVLIFSVIYRCSVVDTNNDRAYKRNVQMCVLFQIKCRLTALRLANIETIATNKNFSRCCFRLRNNYRLDSTAFNMAVYIISTFFLSMVKQQNKNKI